MKLVISPEYKGEQISYKSNEAAEENLETVVANTTTGGAEMTEDSGEF